MKISGIKCQLLCDFSDFVIPFEEISRDNFIDLIIKDFQFVKREIEGKDEEKEKRKKLVFINGIFELSGGEKLLVDRLSIYSDAIFASGNKETKILVEFYNKILEKINTFCNRKIPFDDNVERKVYNTECYINLDFDIYKLFSEKFSEFLKKELEEKSSENAFDISVEPFNIRIALRASLKDQHDIKAQKKLLETKYFEIEFKRPSDYFEKRYLTSSYFDYDAHLELIRKLEESIKS